jgi:predicted DNA-binding transcriptional regulator AlpA
MSDGNVEKIKTDEPLLVTAREVSQMLRVSLRTLGRMRSAGDVPASIKVGGNVRWRLQDIREWIENGCPSLKGDGRRG